MPASDHFEYELFGLSISSDLAIPELSPAVAPDSPDVRIKLGKCETGTRIPVDGVADYFVIGGCEIWVAVHPGAALRNVRLYLLGSAMGLLLHQRGLLPLHANSIDIGGRAFAFMGPSGSGKSTLAAWFHDRGHAVIADDVSVIDFDSDDAPLVHRGLPRLRLWKSALEASGRDTSNYVRSYAGADDWDKFDVPLDAERIAVRRPLAAIYLLDAGIQSRIDRLDGAAAANALYANTYRGHFVALAGEPQLHWESCVRLLRSTPIYRAHRRWGLEHFDFEAGRLLAHARSVAG